jgi:outer membrane protein assembly factor BamA
MTGRTAWMLLAACVAATPAHAQTDDGTRAAAALAARQEKAAVPAPFRPGKVERFLNRLERRGMLNPGAADGFGVRIGGIESGSGLAVGPSWRSSSLRGGNLHLSASGARGLTGDTGIDVGLWVPRVGSYRIGAGLDASATRLTQERFFGRGLDTARADQTAFSLSQDRVTARLTYDATRWFRLSAGAGVATAVAGEGHARRAPSIETRFTGDDAPGLDVPTRARTASLAATVDYRDVPMNPRSGGRYHLAVERVMDRPAARHTFTRIDTELEQHLSFAKRQRVITLRALATATVADRGNEVPFYLQPTLGGSRLLRGFVTDRFRDLNIVALQAEYGWDLLPFLSAVAFAEAGAAAPRWQEIDGRQLRKDYGIGFRFGSARTVAFRTDVAFGSGEGTRLTMRFNHAF